MFNTTRIKIDDVPFPLFFFFVLEQMEIKCQGITADLRREEEVDGKTYRYWTERSDTLDGAPFDKTVTVEAFVDGQWNEVFQYDGRRLRTGIVKDETVLRKLE